MLVKDIIKIACGFIGQTSLKEALESNSALSEDEQLICDSLVNFFNLAYNEVACEYIPIYRRERVKCEDFKVNYSSLTEAPLQIISVKDMSGRKVKFKAFDDHLVAIASQVDILYTVQPEKCEPTDTFSSSLPERVYAYAIAREYYFMQTLFDEADVWEERFKNSLQVLQREKREIVMPRRRWV